MKQLNNLEKAKIRLSMMEPFFATILMKYPLRESKLVPIAAVTPKGEILYNSEGIKDYSVDQLVFILCHEVLHVVYMHALRRGNRNHFLYNIASDAVINETLIAAGVGKPLEGCVRFSGAENMTSEEVYDLLNKNAQMKAEHMDLICDGDSSMGDGANSSVKNATGEDDPLADARKAHGQKLSDGQKKLAETKTKMDISEAVSMARMRNKNIGGAKGALLRKLEEFVMCEKLPWYEYLSRFMTGFVSQGESWRRPNRRFSNVYLPTTDRLPAMGQLIVGIDTSGSIGPKELAAFAKHLNDVVEDCRPAAITVLWCDSEISGVDEFTLDDVPFKLEPKGGGGTDMREITNWCNDNAPDADTCVIFTDGWTPYPDEGEELVPTLWVLTEHSGQIPDYINHVEFEIEED